LKKNGAIVGRRQAIPAVTATKGRVLPKLGFAAALFAMESLALPAWLLLAFMVLCLLTFINRCRQRTMFNVQDVFADASAKYGAKSAAISAARIAQLHAQTIWQR